MFKKSVYPLVLMEFIVLSMLFSSPKVSAAAGPSASVIASVVPNATSYTAPDGTKISLSQSYGVQGNITCIKSIDPNTGLEGTQCGGYVEFLVNNPLGKARTAMVFTAGPSTELDLHLPDYWTAFTMSGPHGNYQITVSQSGNNQVQITLFGSDANGNPTPNPLITFNGTGEITMLPGATGNKHS